MTTRCCFLDDVASRLVRGYPVFACQHDVMAFAYPGDDDDGAVLVEHAILRMPMLARCIPTASTAVSVLNFGRSLARIAAGKTAIGALRAPMPAIASDTCNSRDGDTPSQSPQESEALSSQA